MKLNPDDSKPLGKYGLMRKSYLKQAVPAMYNFLLLNDTLMAHLHEIDKQAWEMMERLAEQLRETHPYPNPCSDWEKTCHSLMLHGMAEEIVVAEIIQTK